MATTRTRYVNTASSGGDGTTNNTSGGTAAYASLTAALTAEVAAVPGLVAGDLILDILCEGTAADTSTVSVSGFTTDATRYLKIRGNTTSAGKHAGVWSTGKYRISNSNYNGAFLIGINHCRIENIQVESTANDDARAKAFSIDAASGEIFITGCICRYAPSATPTTSSSNHGISDLLNASNSTKVVLANNVIYNFTKQGIHLTTSGRSGTTAVLYNNTIIDCVGSGIYYDASGTTETLRLQNNLVQSCTGSDIDIDGTPATYTHLTNISEDTSSPDTTFRSKVAAFVDEAGDDFRLSTSDTVAKNLATDLSADGDYAFAIDNIGTTRPDGAGWDIGAFEAVAGGGGGSTKPYYYNSTLGD